MASPAAPPSLAYMPQVPPSGTVIKQEYNFQMQPLLQQCRPSCSFCADPNHWTRMCTLIEVYIHAGKITRGTDNHLYLADGSQIPRFPECQHARCDCCCSVQGTANLFCVAHPKIDVQFEIQPSAFLNTVQDADEPVADLANPDFQAYVAQAWATYQVDKVDPRAATVEEEIISPGIQSLCATRQASNPSTPAPTSTTTKSYVPPTSPAPTPACKDPVPTAIAPSQTLYPAARNQNQYCYSFPLKDEATPKHIVERVLETSVAMPVKELFAVAPEFHKQFRDITMAKRVTTNKIEVVHSDDEEGVQVNELTGHDPQRTARKYRDRIICGDDGSIVAHHTLPLRCIEAKVPGTDVTINCILDSGSEIVAMPRHVWEKIGLPLRCNHLMTMTSANMSKDTTVGILENLKLDFGAGPVMLQVQVIEYANFNMLLGHLFICLMSAVMNNYPDSRQWITL
ncbi:hypothetical protein M404DRAFT_26467 [Pisolithus tinctorius Marx 270]|uniref:Uncharacterized protein n=1 Tax=Pisolithus tinctorius Marx 270 TaxID=870435 RepID=A0A0C3P956_PISTI|nr:hypothetical protein M404DRAFT_26467 [Pisolithus tinctorius Marx 270]